ncbi:RtcB family protein [Candidatus Magnetaquicoccus inordinatus]|uniref:RtcB family protein n=1 Tax=Candidatus Magnetaquicoccus inordinatus TaxID=2496818 RepID=UPI00102CA665|nr:RtcB family protein [Candidatus Magnetaquicoccus inordinatus]
MPIYEVIHTGRVPVHVYADDLDATSRKQLMNVANLPFVFRQVAAMPDVHAGLGAVIGSVIPTEKAVIPAAVGVDIGCGMQAVKLALLGEELQGRADDLRAAIEQAVPHGRTDQGGANDQGAWQSIPIPIRAYWAKNGIEQRLPKVLQRHPKLLHKRVNAERHLGTLGTGNHFIEICLDEGQQVWVLLHSGSRGIGNRIGTYFIEQARRDMGRALQQLPDADLAWLQEGTDNFQDYVQAVAWAQEYAKANRRFMMQATLAAMSTVLARPLAVVGEAIDCHHNTMEREEHFQRTLWVTRKGAIRARKTDLGIVPGSMGSKSYIVRGKGNQETFCSSAHGAGRKMSRNEAARRFTTADLQQQTEGVSCRKSASVMDEIPAAYKDIDKVMARQSDLVEILHVLKQIVCVKG